jgi:hypothetical protein
MLTPRRSAQLGLGGACLVLVSSVAVLVAGGSDSGREVSSANRDGSTPVFTAPAVTPSLSTTSSTPEKGALLSTDGLK